MASVRAKRRRPDLSPPSMSPAVNGEGFDTSTEVLSRVGETEESCDVAVVGAGPAGLMLAANLVRYGVKTRILDDRESKTSAGRADGLQPKSIETLKQMRLASPLLQKGVKIFDISFWESTVSKPLHRTARQVHYPESVGALESYILLVHQGMVEDIFLEDLAARKVQVERSAAFVSYTRKDRITAYCQDTVRNIPISVKADYLVGCDGAHSAVRKSMPHVMMEGESGHASWAVLDGVIKTDFPDLWSKVVVSSKTAGTILCIPRERNMTRLYIELNSGSTQRTSKDTATQMYVMQKAREILRPFTLEWESVDWFGNYQIGQRVANHFSDEDGHVLIAGDAAHTHSPKAAQGMNTSMHDGFNLAWKLNLAVRGLAAPSLLPTYEHERRKIANDLITFDREHVEAFKQGDAALAKNFDDNIRFISGVGAEYSDSVLVESEKYPHGALRAGALLIPARVTRYIDANPVDIQLDIPLLGQFRIYFVVPDVQRSMGFLEAASSSILSPESFLSQVSTLAKKSYSLRPAGRADSDEFVQPQRYTTVSPVFTYSLVTQTEQSKVEITDLPPVLRDSSWTFYLDDIKDAKGMTCTQKWLGAVASNEVVIVNVRPDGYVGSVGRFDAVGAGSADLAIAWLENYYGGFLRAREAQPLSAGVVQNGA